MFSKILQLFVAWLLLTSTASSQDLTVGTSLPVGDQLGTTAGGTSQPLLVTVVNNSSNIAAEDFLSAWQLSLEIVPDAGSTGEVSFATASQPNTNYVFSGTGSLGTSVSNSGTTLLAFDAQFPFTGGVHVPTAPGANLLELTLAASASAYGGFGLFAQSARGSSEWTDAQQPIMQRRQFENVPDDSGLIRIADILVGLPGDFDHDFDVDGTDFLVWQRGGSPDPLSNLDLLDWQDNFGGTASNHESISVHFYAVPEPSCWSILLGWMITSGLSWRLSHRIT